MKKVERVSSHEIGRTRGSPGSFSPLAINIRSLAAHQNWDNEYTRDRRAKGRERKRP